ncbi:hypothetical protein HG530_014121 [Fusarium avenaceum]|nr:hypothetical protein HG530_014121 [Fusarium avenaceum]
MTIPLQCLQALEEQKRLILEALPFKHIPNTLLEDIVLDLGFGRLLAGLQPMLSRKLNELMLLFFHFGWGRSSIGRLWLWLARFLRLSSAAALESLHGWHCRIIVSS